MLVDNLTALFRAGEEELSVSYEQCSWDRVLHRRGPGGRVPVSIGQPRLPCLQLA
jgi:hypothetical protein